MDCSTGRTIDNIRADTSTSLIKDASTTNDNVLVESSIGTPVGNVRHVKYSTSTTDGNLRDMSSISEISANVRVEYSSSTPKESSNTTSDNVRVECSSDTTEDDTRRVESTSTTADTVHVESASTTCNNVSLESSTSSPANVNVDFPTSRTEESTDTTSDNDRVDASTKPTKKRCRRLPKRKKTTPSTSPDPN